MVIGEIAEFNHLSILPQTAVRFYDVRIVSLHPNRYRAIAANDLSDGPHCGRAFPSRTAGSGRSRHLGSQGGDRSFAAVASQQWLAGRSRHPSRLETSPGSALPQGFSEPTADGRPTSDAVGAAGRSQPILAAYIDLVVRGTPSRGIAIRTFPANAYGRCGIVKAAIHARSRIALTAAAEKCPYSSEGPELKGVRV